MSAPDIYSNQIGHVLVVAPAPGGRLNHLVEEKNVIFERGGSRMERGLTRWIFADIPRRTLEDDWGNQYDHQVHSLLVGDLTAGQAFVEGLTEQGFVVEQAEQLFVPLQTLDPNDASSSDQLRHQNPRAFALARRETPHVNDLVTHLRDAIVVGAK